jgi:hypothetical protein
MPLVERLGVGWVRVMGIHCPMCCWVTNDLLRFLQLSQMASCFTQRVWVRDNSLNSHPHPSPLDETTSHSTKHDEAVQVAGYPRGRGRRADLIGASLLYLPNLQ